MKRIFTLAVVLMLAISCSAANKNLFVGWMSTGAGGGDFYHGQSNIIYVTGNAKLSVTLSQASLTHIELGVASGTTLAIDTLQLAVTAKGGNVIQSLTGYTYNGNAMPQSITVTSSCATFDSTHPCMFTFDLSGITFDEAHDYYIGIAYNTSTDVVMSRCLVDCYSPLSGWWANGESTVQNWAVSGTVSKNYGNAQWLAVQALTSQ